MLASADVPSAGPDPADVVVTVTTRRYDQPGGSSASGRASRRATSTRPSWTRLRSAYTRGRSTRYSAGSSRDAPRPAIPSTTSARSALSATFLIAVRPAGDTDGTPRCKTRPLRALFLDYAAQPDQHAVAA